MCLGRDLNFKLIRIASLLNKCMVHLQHLLELKNSAQVSSCQLKFVHDSLLAFSYNPEGIFTFGNLVNFRSTYSGNIIGVSIAVP
jgi:hypothetical protein